MEELVQNAVGACSCSFLFFVFCFLSGVDGHVEEVRSEDPVLE